MPVCELTNAEIKAETDTMDMENTDNSLVGVRCDGRFEIGRNDLGEPMWQRCRIWFYFRLEKSNG